MAADQASAAVPGGEPARRGPSRLLAAALAGVAIEACLVALVMLGDLSLQIIPFLILFGMSMVLCVGSFAVLRGHRDPRSRCLILGVAVLLRLTLLPAAPTLSDDIYRYLWEGRLVLAGENPYQLPPSAEELEHLRDTRHSRINHPELTTIYPPAAQLVFAISQLLSPRPWSMKLLALLADLGLVLLLERLLLERGTDPANLVLYAWHPLPIIELSGSGHIDGIAIASMVAALLLLARRRRCWSVVLLALSALTKLFTLALIPTWAQRVGWPRVLGLTASLALVAYLPFARAGRGLVGTSMVYAETWRFNGSLFDLLALVLGSGEGARIVDCLAFAAAAAVLPMRGRDPVRIAAALTMLFILLSPTVHPWYVLWVLPFVCLRPSAAWLWLSGAVALAYLTLGAFVTTGVWREVPGVRLIEYGPFALLLALETLRRGRRPEPGDALPDGLA